MNSRWTAPFRFARAMYHALLYLLSGRPVIAPELIRKHREAICKPCRFNDHYFCRRCSCLIAAKVCLASEQCPDTPPRWKSL